MWEIWFHISVVRENIILRNLSRRNILNSLKGMIINMICDISGTDFLAPLQGSVLFFAIWRWASPIAVVLRPTGLGIHFCHMTMGFAHRYCLAPLQGFGYSFLSYDDGLRPSLLYYALIGLGINFYHMTIGFAHRCCLAPLQGSCQPSSLELASPVAMV